MTQTLYAHINKRKKQNKQTKIIIIKKEKTNDSKLWGGCG
jgi:hypothetical protein